MPLPTPRSHEKAPSGHGRHACPPVVTALLPAQPSTPLPTPLPIPLSRFNAAPAAETTSLLMRCCDSRHWAARITACRPYPDMDALLAALDEASYDMAPEDLSVALEAESAQLPSAGDGAPARAAAGDQRGVLAAHTALRAAHAAYENRFGHAFLIWLDGYSPGERLDQALAGVRSRLGNDPEEERVATAEELRHLARSRLLQLVVGPH